MIRYNITRGVVLVTLPDDDKFVWFADVVSCNSNSVYFRVETLEYDYKFLVNESRLTIVSLPLKLYYPNDIESDKLIHGCVRYFDGLTSSEYGRLSLFDCKKGALGAYNDMPYYMHKRSLKTVYGRYRSDIIGVRVTVGTCNFHKTCFEGIEIIPVNLNELILFEVFLMVISGFLESNNVDDAVSVTTDCVYPLVF